MVSIANAGDDATENEASVDLKGVIRDLHDEISQLNSLLKTFGSGLQANTKNFHKSTADQVMLIKLQGEMVRQNADYRKSLSTSQDSMKMFTSALKGGLPAMAVFGAMVKKVGGLSNELDNFKAASKDFTDFQKKVGVDDQKSKGFANLSKQDQGSYLDKQESMQQADKKRGGAFGGKGGMSGKMVEGISQMGKFGKKHMGGIILGAGVASMLLGVLKKALDVSPMFQQMMKLLNFGIMMVLRPIGDFFGFLFRPILIMLLRKFIIPWYTKMYPVMMKMGNIIGEKLSGAFEALAAGDVAGAFAILFEDVDFKKILGDAFSSLKTWIKETDWAAVWKAIALGLLTFGTEIWDKIVVPIFSAVADELAAIDWWSAIWQTLKVVLPVFAVADFIAGIFGIGNDKWFNEWGRALGEWFADALGISHLDLSAFWDDVYVKLTTGLDEIVTNWSGFFTDIKDWFLEGLTSMSFNWTELKDIILDFFNPVTQLVTAISGDNNNNNNNNNGLDPEPQRNWWEIMGDGGHITEPIAGVGRSGKHYLLGESGNETVIPDDQLGGMGGSITINIQNMSASQQDLNNLRQTILDVVQESSARRGRA